MLKVATWLLILVMTSVLSADVAVVAHRGASAYAPENSIPAFELAWAMGADAIEGDFRLTSDKQIVCIHDEDTKGASGEDHEVETTAYAVLRELNVGPDRSTFIPLLSEVLDTVPSGRRIFVEIKSGEAIVPYLVEVLEAHPISPAAIFVISFDAEVLTALKKKAPHFETGLLINFKRSGLALKPTVEEIFQLAEQCNADAISVEAHPLMAPGFGREVRRRGYGFHVWTVDQVASAVEMVNRGAQSVTTNRPDLLRANFSREP